MNVTQLSLRFTPLLTNRGLPISTNALLAALSMLTSSHYELASASSSSPLHSSTLAAAASSSVEAPADPGLSCATSKPPLPVYLRHHPKKYRLGNYESPGIPSQVSWATSFDSCPPLLSPSTSLQQHQHHIQQQPQHHHQQQQQQQQQQQFQSFACVTIKTEDFTGLPYSPSTPFSSPAYAPQPSPLPSYSGATSMLAQPDVKASYFGAAPPMPQLHSEPNYVTMLPNYGCGPEVYFSSGAASPGKNEPGISPFYAQDVTSVYPADSSSFAGVPTGYESSSPRTPSEVKVGAAAAANQVRPSHCPERELSLYKNKMQTKLCDVCEDTAAGFHCGAFVCEACKKFFIRSWKADNSQRYQCTKSEACKITKDTRTHCQRCRYKKCIELRMVPPNMRPTVSPDMSAIPCRVCGAQSSGFHFGAITCEGCKGFFRRTIHERCNNSYTCTKSGNCLINVQTRNNCKACRFIKCLSEGMSKTGSRIGRQPNAIKYLCGEEIRAQLKQQRQQQQQQPQALQVMPVQHLQSVTSAMVTSQAQLQQQQPPPMTTVLTSQAQQQQQQQQQQHHQDLTTPPTLIPAVQRLSTPAPMGHVASAEVTSSVTTLESNDASGVGTPVAAPVPELIAVEALPSNAWSLTEFREYVVNAWEKRHIDVNKQSDISNPQEAVPVATMTEQMSIKEVLDIMMDRFLAHTKQLVNFAKRSPDFFVLNYPYQCLLVTEAIYSFTLIQLSVDFDLERDEYNYFDFTKHERSIILRHFPSYEVICQHLVESGRLIKMCALDRVELALLSYLEFVRGDFSCSPGVLEQNARANAIFARLEERAFSALQDYIELHKPNSALCGINLTQIHNTLVRMNREHYEVVRALPQVARSSFSNLFNDMFRLSNRPCEVEEADSTTAGAGDCTPLYGPMSLSGQTVTGLQQQHSRPEVSTTRDDDLFQ